MEEPRPVDILQRTAPQNIEAEKSVIGSMLMDKDAIETALGMLTLGVGIQDVDWLGVLSVSALAAVYSLLKSIVVGMPEGADDADL